MFRHRTMRWFWKNKVHFLVLGIFAVYILTANQLYAALVLKHGKPLPGETSLPSENVELLAYVEDFKSITYEGEEVYELSGWVFAPGVPGSGQFQKKLVLHSTHGNLIFQADPVYRTDLNEVFSKYGMNLDKAGFRVLISKYVLSIDNYKFGFILEDPESGRQVYEMLDWYIQREPNQLRYVSGP